MRRKLDLLVVYTKHIYVYHDRFGDIIVWIVKKDKGQWRNQRDWGLKQHSRILFKLFVGGFWEKELGSTDNSNTGR